MMAILMWHDAYSAKWISLSGLHITGSEEIKMITKKNKSPTTGADRSPRNEVKKAASSTSSTVKARKSILTINSESL